MAHFSLGQTLSQAGRFGEAAEAFTRCVDLNPAMTKGFQLAGAAYMAAGDDERARAVLTKGYEEATTRGDLMPKKAMADLLGQLGAPVPEVANAPAPSAGGGSFKDRKSGRMGTQLGRPPFRNGVGTWIHEHISQETFDEWIRLGVTTAVICPGSRSTPLALALGVDVIPAPALAPYAEANPHVQLAWLDSRSAAFRELLHERGPFDLAFVDDAVGVGLRILQVAHRGGAGRLDLVYEARGGQRHQLPKEQPPRGIGQRERLLCARHAHVEQAPLLLNIHTLNVHILNIHILLIAPG